MTQGNQTRTAYARARRSVAKFDDAPVILSSIPHTPLLQRIQGVTIVVISATKVAQSY